MRTISFEPLWKTLESRGLSKRELAERSNLSRNTLFQISKNESVTLETILKICNALDCEIYEVIECRYDSQSSNSI